MRIPDQPIQSPLVAPTIAPVKAPGVSSTGEPIVPPVPKSSNIPQTTIRSHTGSHSQTKPGQRAPNGENTTEQQLEDAVKALNETMAIFDRKLQFEIHEETHRIMVRVIDSQSGEVIREIPPQKILDMVGEMWKMIGLLIDEKG